MKSSSEIEKRNNIYWDLPYPDDIIPVVNARHRASFSIHKPISDQSVLVAEIKVFIKLEVKKTPKNDFVNV